MKPICLVEEVLRLFAPRRGLVQCPTDGFPDLVKSSSWRCALSVFWVSQEGCAMIPNALASTGAYASLWSHLKSIDHALQRATDTTSSGSLSSLDKERLGALVGFLKEGLTPSSGPGSAIASFPSSELHESKFTSAIDLRERISRTPDFDEWMRTSRKGFDFKLQRLIAAVEQFLTKNPKHLFPKDAPVEEFEILRSILQSMIIDAEAALV
jgi:hypothetical protein